jgi:hypothetical protein
LAPRAFGHDRWAAEITVGYDNRGRQKKERVYGQTQSDARRKLDEMKERRSQGLPPTLQTVEQFLNNWLNTVCRPPNVSLKTHRTYRDLAEGHIIPALGRI